MKIALKDTEDVEMQTEES